jgi:hypothetical protein
MDRKALIEQFSTFVNEGFRSAEDRSTLAYNLLRAQLADHEMALLDQLYENYREAIQPSEFVTHHITTVDALFEQAYELERITFNPAVLSPREKYVHRYRQLAVSGKPRPYIMLCRAFRVAGAHRYDTAGHLIQFNFDPLAAVEGPVCATSATYIDMSSVGRPSDGIIGIGHLATREYFRRKGHARAVIEQLEQESVTLAAQMGQQLRLILLESEPDARSFWASCGYRYPLGSRYYQPPIDFDPDTGYPLFEEVPELLMVKVIESPKKHTVDRVLMLDSVKALYQRWYTSEANNPAASQKIYDYVFGKLFEDFAASLQGDTPDVTLAMPSLE